ncbi:hypothetical protein [Luteimonas deserti]|uniref:Peptidase C-terminal archaeal/bacterial domain-containing protein n=1 Tax=Luteimonas deserti TaxID=2752306 RepID=A0A7Z0QMJ9_9GAMM|nr:hypothetical protein [Luteimonas deserti]NYZ61406.1 hypothetical protein [Luteimonas deserti]
MSVTRTVCGLCAALVLVGGSMPAGAQSGGRFVLGAGFTPDPQTAQGRTGGDTQASRFGPQCTGVVASTPHHTIRVTSALDLQLALDSTTDSTLVVVGPAGVFCDDDSGGQLDARVQARLTPGDYAVYVGHIDTPGSYTLSLTERAGVTAGTSNQYADFRLGAGFTPDPQVGTGTTGGPVQASTYGAHCTGMVDSTPDHRLTITSTVTLRLAVTSTTDSSLVVRGAGKVLCDDDSGGALDAAIVDSFRPGEYEIYVGQLGEPGEYRLTLSETR